MQIEVQLSDFQAHENTKLTLREGLACVVGPTNVGKSSIVRAIRWLMYDSLRGTRHIRKGKDSASVTLRIVAGGASVETERVKGKAGNRYRVNTTWFDAIGVGTPAEVGKALGIVPVKIDKDVEAELNVSMQLDTPFLVMETDSTRAKFLNVLTGGHVIDASVRETSRVVRSVEDGRKAIRTQLEGIESKLKSFEDLQIREAQVKQTRDAFDLLQNKFDQLTKLRQVRDNLNVIRKNREITSKKLSAIRIGNVTENLKKVELLLSLKQRKASLVNIGAHRQQTQISIDQVKHQLYVLQQKFLGMPDVECESCGQLITSEVRTRQLETVI